MCGKVRDQIPRHFLILLAAFHLIRYTESKVSDIEWAWQLSDHLEGLNWDKLVEGRSFTFIQVSEGYYCISTCLHHVRDDDI